MTNDTDFDDTTLRVSESNDKFQAKTTITRGTGTRDQEATKLRAKGDEPKEAIANLATMVEAYLEVGQTLRAFQPEEADDE
jgi:hypothetical protein